MKAELEGVFATLASTPDKLRREIAALSPRVLKTRPAPDKWSIREILAHLADVEGPGFRERAERILQEDRPLLEPFDQEKRAIEKRYDRTDPNKSLASLAAGRRANVRWARTLRPAQLRRVGFHPQVGEVSILNYLHEWAYHDLGHLRQILEIKRGILAPQMGNMRKFYNLDPSAAQSGAHS